MNTKKSESKSQTPTVIALKDLGTTLGRARCLQPAQIQRMVTSLSVHGQMTAVIAVMRQHKVELVDGFKRRAAAVKMGWERLRVNVRKLDERAQWIAMLTLNRTAGSLSVLEEALILRELVQAGMTQVEVAELSGRHRSWVSRRLGLVERLHPDLVEWVKTGLLSPGTARRLFVLPAGNQVEMAAVVTQKGLTTTETERLVSLWRKTSDPQIRRFLLKEPQRALAQTKADDLQPKTNPRLSPRGQTLQRSLQIWQGVTARILGTLKPVPTESDLEILLPELRRVEQILPILVETLGFANTSSRSDVSSATNATRAS